MSNDCEEILIRAVMSSNLSSYKAPEIINALVDYRVNGCSGVEAARVNGLHHRNTVYRAEKHYEGIIETINDIIIAMGKADLYAKTCRMNEPALTKIERDWFLSIAGAQHASVDTICLYAKLGKILIPISNGGNHDKN